MKNNLAYYDVTGEAQKGPESILYISSKLIRICKKVVKYVHHSVDPDIMHQWKLEQLLHDHYSSNHTYSPQKVYFPSLRGKI